MNQNDVRRKYRYLMDDMRYRYPRSTVINHPIEWYLDGHLSSRPLTAVYSYALLAEHFLHLVRFGKRGQAKAYREVEEFFAFTRRAMQNVLSTYHIGVPLKKTEREAVSRVASRLCESARVAHEALDEAANPCTCPACRGERLKSTDAELLEAILCEQSRLGTIPITSKLFRASSVDKPPRTVV